MLSVHLDLKGQSMGSRTTGPLAWIAVRYARSFWFRTALSAGLFFIGMLYLSATIPGSQRPWSDIRVVPALAVVSLAWGSAMSVFLGWMQQGRRIRRLEAEMTALRAEIDGLKAGSSAHRKD